jgi:hypothetical protein
MVFPDAEGNNVGSVDLQGRPEPEDVRGGTSKSPVSSSGEPENKRRRVILHQGLPDPDEQPGQQGPESVG